MSFQPVTDISQVHLVHAEDADYVRKELGFGITQLLGISDENYHPFPRVDQAKSFLEKLDKDKPTIVLLDNMTPPSEQTGMNLAQELLKRKEEFPNLIIVTITSSDMGLVFENEGKQVTKLKEAGGEFWAKHQEGRLCLLWLGECLRRGEVIPREDWLKGLGIETEYTSSTESLSTEGEEYAILELIEDIRHEFRTLEDVGMEKGDFFKLKAKEVLTKLGFPGRGIEGQPPTIES